MSFDICFHKIYFVFNTGNFRNDNHNNMKLLIVFKIPSSFGKSSLQSIRDFTQSGRGNRMMPRITSFDYHVLPEGVALIYLHASDEDGHRNIPWSSEQVGLGGD